MIFKVSSINNDLIQSAYDEGMRVLNEFWGINWEDDIPDIYVLQSRKDIDALKGRKTEDWVVGFGGSANAGKAAIYLLDPDKYDSESNHKKDDNRFKALITHELCHLFVFHLQERTQPIGPMWWNEGICVYLSGQLKYHRKPEKFVGFLDSSRNNNPKMAYDEGGYVIELLVNKFGKNKLTELIELLGNEKTDGEIKELFTRVYGFELTYDEMNKLYLEK